MCLKDPRAQTQAPDATIFVVEDGIAHARTLRVRGERGGSLYFDTHDLEPGTSIVTEGRALLVDGDRVLARAVPSDTAMSPAASSKGDSK